MHLRGHCIKSELLSVATTSKCYIIHLKVSL